MVNFLFFIGCFVHAKPKYDFVKIGVVDQADSGVCVVEVDNWYRDKYSPETIYIYSKQCKDGDIIAFGRKM